MPWISHDRDPQMETWHEAIVGILCGADVPGDGPHGLSRDLAFSSTCVSFSLLFPPYISLPPLLRVSIITCITIGAVRTKAWPGDEQAPGVLGKVKYSLISIEMTRNVH